MNISIRGLARRVARVGLIVGPFGLGIAMLAQPAGAESCATPDGTALQQRVRAHARQGTAALRQYVTRTRNVYALDLREELERFEREQGAERACEAALVADGVGVPALARPADAPSVVATDVR